jgi:hypothetical protein
VGCPWQEAYAFLYQGKTLASILYAQKNSFPIQYHAGTYSSHEQEEVVKDPIMIEKGPQEEM